MGLLTSHRGVVLATIIAYFALTLFLGYLGRTKKEEQKAQLASWAVAGRNIGWIILGLAWSATYFSSYAVLGVSGSAYTNGLSVMTITTAYFVPTGVVMYVLGSAVNILGRKNEYFTIGDLLQDRFETKWVRLPLYITMLIFSVYYVGIQLIGAGYVLEKLAGIPYLFAVTLGALVLALYVCMGGFKSTAFTDTLQASLLFLALFGGGIVAIYITKGQLFSLLIDKFGVDAITSPGLKSGLSPRFAVSFNANIIIYTFGFMFMQWLLSASNPKSLKNAAITYSVICPAGYIFGSILIGLAGLALGIQVTEADYIFPTIIVELFGPLVGALLIAGVLGATQSTAASVLAGVSLSSSYDFYQEIICSGKEKEGRVVLISRVLTFVILIASLLFAMNAGDAILVLGAVGIAFFSVMAPVVTAALYFPGTTGAAAVLSPFIGLLFLVYVIFVNKNFLDIHPGLWGFVSTTISLFIISAFTKPSSQEVIEKIHGTVGRIYNKDIKQLWYPISAIGKIAAIVMIVNVFAISYGLHYIKTTILVMGMPVQFIWVIGWVVLALITEIILFKKITINENV